MRNRCFSTSLVVCIAVAALILVSLVPLLSQSLSSNPTIATLSGQPRSIVLSPVGVAELSNMNIVPTIVERGTAFALGFVGDKVFKTELLPGVTRAYGVSKGRLLFSRRAARSEGESLFVADLRSGEILSVFIDLDVIRAAWHPTSQTIAVIFREGQETGLLAYEFEHGITRIIRKNEVGSRGLKWSEDGNTLQFEVYDKGIPAKRLAVLRPMSSENDQVLGLAAAEGRDSTLTSVAEASTGFDYPVGPPYRTQAFDGDGWYNIQDFGVSNHLGEESVPIVVEGFGAAV